MSSIKSWIVAARLFAVPWVFVNCLLGAKLAGFDLSAFITAFSIVASLLLASHYMNAWRDYVRGLDRIDGSKAKKYTTASRLIVEGKFTVAEAKLATIGWTLIAIGLFILFAPKRIDTVAIFALGSIVALTYTDFFKPRGFGELALFLAHGFGSVCFAYSFIKPITLEGVAAGILLGMWAGMAYTIDQWYDVETDFARRVKNFAHVVAKANIKLSSFYWFAVTAIITTHFGFVLLGFLQPTTLLVILLLPLYHITGVYLDYQFEKGILLALLGMWLYPIAMILGGYIPLQ